jgi:enoyl-CoA hydratase/carnithine racemase
MDHIRVEHDDRVQIVTMARGKANALNEEMVEELLDSVHEAATHDNVRAIVLTSASDKMFSAGFDVSEVFESTDKKMSVFFEKFLGLFERLRTLPKPVVAAITGHAYAGGAILALACDFRLMTDGDSRFALNEVDLGLSLPSRTIAEIVDTIGPVAARLLLIAGDTFTVAQALHYGIVEDSVVVGKLRARAVARARALSEKPPMAFIAHKRAIVAAGRTLDPTARGAAVAEFMHFWSGKESKERRSALIASLKKKKSPA